MAAKTPDSIRKENLGSVSLIIAEFTTTNIDDNDTWASGIPLGKIVSWPKCVPKLDGPQDFAVDAISAAGELTFGSAANQEGYVEILVKNI